MEKEQHDLLYMNTTALAFLGDAVYETFIRDKLVVEGQVHGDLLLTYLSVCLVAHLIVTFSETCLRKKDMPARTPDAFRE